MKIISHIKEVDLFDQLSEQSTIQKFYTVTSEFGYLNKIDHHYRPEINAYRYVFHFSFNIILDGQFIFETELQCENYLKMLRTGCYCKDSLIKCKVGDQIKKKWFKNINFKVQKIALIPYE